MRKIRVLIVDDSFFMVNAIKSILNQSSDIEVLDYASDGLEAVKKIKDLKPDVMTIDLNMPYLDGIKCIKLIMSECPLPIIVVSAYTNDAASDKTIEALSAGAIDFLGKPDGEISFTMQKYATELIDKVKLAVKSNVKAFNYKKIYRSLVDSKSEIKNIIGIGVSTGGPSTLNKMFSILDKKLDMTMIITIHIDDLYVDKFAEILDEIVPYTVKKAEDGEFLKNRYVYICGGKRNFTIESGLKFKVSELAAEQYNTPSVTKFIDSLSKLKKYNRMAIILTGMGNDGSDALPEFYNSGGIVVAQNKESSIIFGMPNCAIKTQKVHYTGNIDDIVLYIKDFCDKKLNN